MEKMTQNDLATLKKASSEIKKDKKSWIARGYPVESRRGTYYAFSPFVIYVGREEFMLERKNMNDKTREIVNGESKLILNGDISKLCREVLYKDDDDLLEIYAEANSAHLVYGKFGSKNNVMYINGGCISLIHRIDVLKDNTFVLNAYLRSTDIPVAGFTDAMVLGEIGLDIENILTKERGIITKFAGMNIVYGLGHFYEEDGINRREKKVEKKAALEMQPIQNKNDENVTEEK